MHSFTIKDLENLTGIKAHTIRIWEQRYNFLKPQRTQTNIRYYSSDELKTILNIALLNKYGYKISHINRMSHIEVQDKILMLSHAKAQQERIVNSLIEHMIALNAKEFETVINNYINTEGIEKGIVDVIFPYLERIGILWLANRVNTAQEHLAANIIRQKLITGIENTKANFFTGKSVLLFLPEGEYHETALLYIHYMLKKQGVDALYLGANVSLKDIEYIIQHKQPDYLYTHLTTLADNNKFERFLQNLHVRTNPKPVIISGQITKLYKKKIPVNIQFRQHLKEVTAFFFQD